MCTFALSLGSEVIQGVLPNDRDFDPWDVLANVLGSLMALFLATAYHKRSIERRRRAKYSNLTDPLMEPNEDLELGDGGNNPNINPVDDGQVVGVVAVPKKTVDEELATWDENAIDDEWEEDDAGGASTAGTKNTPASSSVGDEEVPKKIAVD